MSNLAFCLSAFHFQKAGHLRLQWNASSDETVFTFCCCLPMLHRESISSAMYSINDRQGHAVHEALVM